jgi:preprotein translocase subunit SecA
VTPNSYLAERDHDLLFPAFRLLGMDLGLLPEQAAQSDKRRVYACDVTYGTGYEFGFDYLRDQLALQRNARRELGIEIIGHLQGHRDPTSSIAQRGHPCAIIDEIDNVLMDDAGSPLVLSDSSADGALDADVYRVARSVISRLDDHSDFGFDPATGVVRLTRLGLERIYQDDIPIPFDQLQRTWTEYMEQTLRAEFLMHRDVHYIVRDGAIQIVDSSTGRIFSDRTWRDGLHQAVEAKEGLTITAEKQSLAQITRQRYFRRYEKLCGMSGTAIECRDEFRQVYRLEIRSIPLRIPSQRQIWPTRFFDTTTAKRRAIVRSIVEVHATGRPILVGTRSIQDSEHISELLNRTGIDCQLLNGRQDAEEAAIIAQAGRIGMITIATNLAGRGTDIRLEAGVAPLGGLHVIATEYHESTRVDRQLIGRCARHGDPGSGQIFAALDDSLIRAYGPWLRESMSGFADANGELNHDLTNQIKRIQKSAERNQFASRCRLLRHDEARESLFAH